MISATVGLLLREKREEQHKTIEQVTKATHIRPHYLLAMEAGDFSAIPSQAQAKGFLRAYAEYLGLKVEPLFAELEGRAAGAPLSAAEAPEDEPPAEAENASNAPLSPLTSASPAAPPRSEAPEPLGQPGSAEAPAPAKKKAAGRPAPPGASGADAPIQNAPPHPTPRRLTIFQQIGQTLQKQREVLGLSLDDVERHTHLRSHYLQALEDGDMSRLPSPVQGRGMLNNYAVFLGMDPEPLLLRFAEGLQARHSASRSSAGEKRPAKVRRKSILPPGLRRMFSADLLIGLALVAFLLVFVGWLTLRIFTQSSASQAGVTATAPSIVDVLLASPTPTLTPTLLPAAPTAPVLPTQNILVEGDPAATPAPMQEGELTPAAEGGVQIVINVSQRSWMRVTVDGKVEFEGRVVGGSVYNFAGAEQVQLLTGNGAGLRVVYNGFDLGVLGTYGQIIDRIFTPTGITEPTPTAAPTLETSAEPTTAPTPQP